MLVAAARWALVHCFVCSSCGLWLEVEGHCHELLRPQAGVSGLKQVSSSPAAASHSCRGSPTQKGAEASARSSAPQRQGGNGPRSARRVRAGIVRTDTYGQ